MATLERAVVIATEAHAGAVDKGGAPYILHPLRLMLAQATPEARMVAVLHDVVEDSSWTLEQLRAEGFPEDVVEAVDHLTRRKGESYEAFIERIAPHPLARRVKLADIEDNLDLRRLETMGESEVSRFNRYFQARRVLLAAAED